ncbi:hypothetical protein D044_3543B, partial [Vibrio parahaemolyticus EKP-026]
WLLMLLPRNTSTLPRITQSEGKRGMACSAKRNRQEKGLLNPKFGLTRLRSTIMISPSSTRNTSSMPSTSMR